MGRIEELAVTASQYMCDGNLEKAISTCHMALIINNKNKSILETLGLAYFANNEFAEAETYYKKSLELEPENITSRNKLAEIYLKQNKYNEAFLELNKILDTYPENIMARVRLGDSYMIMKRYDDAIREYSFAIKQKSQATATTNWPRISSIKKYDRLIQIQTRKIENLDRARAYIGLIEASFAKRDYAQTIIYASQHRAFKLKNKIRKSLYKVQSKLAFLL